MFFIRIKLAKAGTVSLDSVVAYIEGAINKQINKATFLLMLSSLSAMGVCMVVKLIAFGIFCLYIGVLFLVKMLERL